MTFISLSNIYFRFTENFNDEHDFNRYLRFYENEKHDIHKYLR